MSRLPRLIVPGAPLHITQRGVDRCATFLADEDYAFYQWALREASSETRCAIHAYVLMTNHVHLLLTPAETAGPARLMRSMGRRYVRYFNDRYRRTGTLWEGRYRSALIDSASYLFACSRYIELNPHRAGVVADPAAYPWSSFHHNACGDADPIITPHPQYAALGAGRSARCAAYRMFFATDLAPDVVATIRAAQHGRPQLRATPYQLAVEATTRHTITADEAEDPADARRRVAVPGDVRSPTSSPRSMEDRRRVS